MPKKTGFMASALAAAAMTFAPMATAVAVPMTPQTVQTQVGTSDVIKVQRRHHRRGFHRRGGRGFYNGHRGSRRHHRGWRRHNGWWFPPAAFALGLALGADRSYDPPRRRGRHSRAHYRWCDHKYRSYRAWDNTYQPYNGPRRQCWSPYD
ncbi:hypothetical protein CSC94_14950 [Zhengella mangrovi]|uniref:Lectin-like protein BA14k n=1 Tax=Zhengella mangrovi TaxID=1982044 RepID=A0A2G1QLA1_9HYPH|nr:BA14K family protein [Zhengella mangrovi]PHP66230.1 hypothetical protein CSC94_14950 [Zhengella mangrovi]